MVCCLMCRLSDHRTSVKRMCGLMASYCVECRLHSVAAEQLRDCARLKDAYYLSNNGRKIDI